MRARIIFGLFGFWSINLAMVAQGATSVPEAAGKYLPILEKRPRTGTLFERFYAAWLEQSSADELREYLKARAAASGAKPAGHLLLAVFHAHRGEDREALTAYEAALSADPADPAAWMERARLESRGLDFAAALKSLDEALKHQPEPALSVEIGKLRARALLRLGKNDEALKVWKELAAAHAQDEDLAEEIIDLLADEGQYEAAIEAARALVEKSRDPLAKTLRILHLADLLLMAERRDEALAVLREALAATGAGSWIEGDVLGRVERVFGMTDDAAGLQAWLGELSREHPQRVALRWQHTQLLAVAGEKDNALKQARELLAANPGRRDLQEGFLDLLEGLGLTKEAVAQARELSRLRAGDRELMMRLAGLEHLAGDVAAARATLEEFLALPGSGEAEYLRVARVLESWEDLAPSPVTGKRPAKAAALPESPAAAAYARLARAFPESMAAQEARAHYLHRHERREEALELWTRLARTAGLEDVLRIAQSLQARLEARPALDLLLAREAEFRRDARFLALLVQLALANKEFARALPWARERLRLARDEEAVEAALRDALALFSGEEGRERALPLMRELQTTRELTIQDRCLLARLQARLGQFAEAEQTLAGAAEADRVVALAQLSQLQQSRADWEKAARSLEQLLAMPQGLSTARVQRVADLWRRADRPDLALPWIARWKTLSPGAAQPWLEEARLQRDLGHDADVLKLLRDAARRFPDSVEAAASLARHCEETGLYEEAERVHRSLYERTTDPVARLRLLGPWAEVAQTRGSLARLIEDFQHRQRQSRASALPWLALAEIHRATGDDEERRRCLYEASRLRPQDLALLHEIARIEEESGLLKEAMRTLQSAVKLDKTTRTRLRLARLQIDNGDAEGGYRALFELAGGDEMDARGIESLAQSITSSGEWERATAFLGPLLQKHPLDYRLHYLHAVALEESGREQDAAEVFVRMLGMHEELPNLPPPPSSQGAAYRVMQQAGIFLQPHNIPLPPGAEDWSVLRNLSQHAYAHREQNARNQVPSAVEMPPQVTMASSYALSHLLRISAVWEEPERQRLAARLDQAGVAHAALLLEAARESEHVGVSTEMLVAHPKDAALHAAWLRTGLLGAPEDNMAAWQRCFDLLRASYPHLAFDAAHRAWRDAEQPDDSALWLRRMIETGTAIAKSDAGEWHTITQIFATRGQPERHPDDPALKLDEDALHRLAGLLLQWMLRSNDFDVIEKMLTPLVFAREWDCFIEGLRHALKVDDAAKHAPISAAPAGFGWDLSLLDNELLDLGLPRRFGRLILMLSADTSDDTEDIPESVKATLTAFQAAMKARLQGEADPRFQLALRLMSADFDSVIAAFQARQQRPEAAPNDFLVPAYLFQLTRKHALALDALKKAASITSEPALRRKIESALLVSAKQLQQEDTNETAREAAKQVFEKWLQEAVTDDEKTQIASRMRDHGLVDESDALMKKLADAPAAGAPGRQAGTRANNGPPSVVNPYSRMLAVQSSPQAAMKGTLERLLLAGNNAGALNEAMRRLRPILREWRTTNEPQKTVEELTKLLLLLETAQLRSPFLLSLKNAAAAGWQPRMDRAAVLEMQFVHGRVFQNNDGDRMVEGEELRQLLITEYQAVLRENPAAHEARRRLVVLLAEDDAAMALKHWQALPAHEQPDVVDTFLHQLSIPGELRKAEIVPVAKLTTTWLKGADAAAVQGAAWGTMRLLDTLKEGRSGWPGLWDDYFAVSADSSVSADPFAGAKASTWEFDAQGVLKLSEEDRQERHEHRMAHDALCRALTAFPALADIGFPPLGGLAIFEDRRIEETERLALDILERRAAWPARRRASQMAPHLSSFNTPLFASRTRIALPSPAVFATWCAAKRGDTRALEEKVLPAILNADGRAVHDFCRGYAALLAGPEADFPAAAAAWMKQARRTQNASQWDNDLHSDGGVLTEILRVWQARRIPQPLDEFILQESGRGGSGPVDPFASSDNHLVVNAYLRRLAERTPSAVSAFVSRLRDHWTSADADARRAAVAGLEKARSSNTSRSTAVNAMERYLDWLKQALGRDYGISLLAFAFDDGLEDSESWMQELSMGLISNHRLLTPDELLYASRALGFGSVEQSARVFRAVKGGGRLSWMHSYVTRFRDRQEPAVIDGMIRSLAQEPPTFANHLLQAMLVTEQTTTPVFDGKAAAKPARPAASGKRGEAVRHVLLTHASELTKMPVQSLSGLFELLRREMPEALHAGKTDPALAAAMKPVVESEKSLQLAQGDALLAVKRWEDLDASGDSRESNLLRVLQQVAPLDPARAEALARHAVQLIRKSSEQQRAQANHLPATPLDQFIQSLARVPGLISVSLALAEQEGLDGSMSWCNQVCFHCIAVLDDGDKAFSVFRGTPFVAQAAAFRDLAVDDAARPTLLARMLGFLDEKPARAAAVRQFLAAQPATFGTRLLQALLLPEADMPAREKAVTAFLQRAARDGDLARLPAATAANLLKLLHARLRGLATQLVTDAALKKILQPLVDADQATFEAAIERVMSTTKLGEARLDEHEAGLRVLRLLDRLAQVDVPRALALLDHTSTLMAREDVAARPRSGPVEPHQTRVSQWLQRAMTVPELFAEVLQRATMSGAAADEAWRDVLLKQVFSLDRYEHEPARIVALLRASGVLDPAATFEPRLLPREKTPCSLLECWGDELRVHTTRLPGLLPLLEKHAAGTTPRAFGHELVLLLCRAPRAQDIEAFATARRAELDALPAGKRALIDELLQRLAQRAEGK